MKVDKNIRLSKLARELNVGTSTIVDFLRQINIEIDSNPNTKISEEAYNILVKKYSSDLNLRKESGKVNLNNTRERKETISIENGFEKSKENITQEETVRVIGKIDSDALKPKRKEVVRDNSESSKIIGKIDNTEPISVVGKINLDSLNKKTRPSKKIRAVEETESSKDSNTSIKKSPKNNNSIKIKKNIRLSELAREFNIEVSTIVDFLDHKNIEIDNNPNAKVSDEAYDLLKRYYNVDLNLKNSSPNEKNEDKLVVDEVDQLDVDVAAEQPDGDDDYGYGKEEIFEYVKLIKTRKQIILQGAPGTGKSFLAEKLSKKVSNFKLGLIRTIQFHSSYSYEDFMEGYKPTLNNSFELKPGVFKKLCDIANDNPKEKIVLIIDEINRGDTSKIFGELMYLLEYRNKEIMLSHSNKKFKIPENIFIIGTMNTADRSLALVDIALRRRFSFITLDPLYNVILEKYKGSQEGQFNIEKLVDNLKKINAKIKGNLSLGAGFQIGQSFFLSTDVLNVDSLKWIWKYDLQPLMQEYFFDDPSEVEEIEKMLFELS